MKICDQDKVYHVIENLFDNAEVVVKVCIRCKTKFEFTKGPNGRIDNERYIILHARNYLQPGHRHYEREFGKPDALRYNDKKMRESSNHNQAIAERNEERIYNHTGSKVF